MALISSANAAEMARKSHAARKAAIDALRIAANPIPLPDPDLYLSRRLYRVREQIERLSDMLDQEEDPAKLDRLASALERLAEMERVLDNRPGPGNRRPPREDPPSSAAKPAPRPAFTHAGPAPRAAAQPPGPSQPAPSLLERPDF